MYDPFAPGKFPVKRQSIIADDKRRARSFVCEVWSPSVQERSPLVLFSHFSGGTRGASSFLCEHLASHGYMVAALDHSENRLPRPSEASNEKEREARLRAWIEARVPDVRFLLDTVRPADQNVGIAGHSFGGWTALAAPSVELRIASVVALAPAGARNPRPGIIPAMLDFEWKRDVPTLIVAGDNDVSIPVDRVRDVLDRIPGRRKLVILRGVDHMHFVDDAEVAHEHVRSMTFPPQLAWMQQEIRPFAELRPEREAHAIINALTLAHFDATLKDQGEADEFLKAYTSPA